MSIGSFVSTGSQQFSGKSGGHGGRAHGIGVEMKQIYIKSVLMDSVENRNCIRNSIKYGNNRYKNCARLL